MKQIRWYVPTFKLSCVDQIRDELSLFFSFQPTKVSDILDPPKPFISPFQHYCRLQCQKNRNINTACLSSTLLKHVKTTRTEIIVLCHFDWLTQNIKPPNHQTIKPTIQQMTGASDIQQYRIRQLYCGNTYNFVQSWWGRRRSWQRMLTDLRNWQLEHLWLDGGQCVFPPQARSQDWEVILY